VLNRVQELQKPAQSLSRKRSWVRIPSGLLKTALRVE